MRTRCAAFLAAFLVLLGISTPVAALSSDVPQPWVSYAQLVARQFQVWLEAKDDAADQFHQLLEERILHAGGDASPPMIVVRVWIDADGAVSKVAFDSLGDAKADALLSQLLTTHPMAEPPPPDMRQPLRIRLRLEANPDAPPSSPAGAP